MYNVKITPQFYIGTLGQKTAAHLATEDNQILSFKKAKEAQEWIDAAEKNLLDGRGCYVLSHGEHARPIFEIMESGHFKEMECCNEEFEPSGFNVIDLAEIPESIRKKIENCNVENEEYEDDCVIFYHDEKDEETDDIYRVAFKIDILEVQQVFEQSDLGNINWDRPRYFVYRA